MELDRKLPCSWLKRVIHFIYTIIKICHLFENCCNLLSIYNGEYIPIQADLSTRDGYKKIADNIFSIDSIVHNSGISHYGLFVDTDPDNP